MFRNRLYYGLKPLLPANVRMAVRSWFARRKRDRVLDTWPILPGSEKPPEGWPGWPDGKQFALVLTHDVEGPAGLAKVRQLMELEQKLGFRSSFNFIPEGGEYTVPKSLRDELIANGFEVAVHDLHHDGKLFRSREAFASGAARINRYVKDWGAAGFRSASMFHNLDWQHDLDVAYDASTFDTDPFEPQPDGVGTIVPFWVPSPVQSSKFKVQSSKFNGSVPSAPPSSGSKFDVQGSMFEVSPSSAINPQPSTLNPELPPLDIRHQTLDIGNSTGYVELPYTLPQDSTLFLLLAERHPDIWFQKLDWIARHGGMAMLDVHPDYLRFDGEPASAHTYPAEFYSRFLQYVRERYGQSFWQPLPRAMARFAVQARPRLHHKPRRICMLT